MSDLQEFLTRMQAVASDEERAWLTTERLLESLSPDLRRMAWHLVETILELPQNLGLKVSGPIGLGQDGFIATPPPRPPWPRFQLPEE